MFRTRNGCIAGIFLTCCLSDRRGIGEQQAGRCEEPVEVPLFRVEDRFDIGDAPIPPDAEILDVARGASDLLQDPAPLACLRARLAGARP